MAPAPEVDDLTRSFGDHTAVDGPSLAVEAGEVLAVLGPNGAGRTTTVRLLDGVLSPDRGRSRDRPAGWPAGCDVTRADPERRGSVPAGMAAPLRILLADDTSELRRILRSMLELDGFDVVADVGTGAEVVGLVRLGVEVDVIVVDERMPDLDGVATARLVRKAQPGQVVLLYTAFPHGELELAARDAGIAAVLGKADGIEALEREITRFAGSLHPRAGGSAQPPSAQHDELQGGGEEEAGEQQDEHEGGGGAHLRPPGGWGTRPVT